MLIRQVVIRVKEHFQRLDGYGGSGDRDEAAIAALAHFEWIPPLMLEYSGDTGGFFYEWTTRPGQEPAVQGRINLLPLTEIYQDWQAVVYFAGQEAAKKVRLQTFKIVDFFADEACVGLFHTAAQAPQLYLYDFSDVPRPLGVDVRGYLEARAGPGLPYWQELLVALNEPGGKGRPFAPAAGTLSGNTARQFAAHMAQLIPGWTLDAFVARYDAVRLPQSA